MKKSRGSAATPSFVSLSGPEGFVDLGEHDPRAFKNVPITAAGLFTLAIAGGNGAAIDLTIKAKLAVGDTVFTFGAVEPTLGTATDIRTAWLGSAHADLTSEPFAHWNNESPAVVPGNCAKCHSGLGYQDFLGVLANPLTDPPEIAPTSNLNDPAPSPGRDSSRRAVAGGHYGQLRRLPQRGHGAFDRGHLPLGSQGHRARRRVALHLCHQGRESTVSVEKKISDAYTAAKITTDDTVSTAVNFINVHYFAAAGSLYGREAETAYEYADPTKAALPVDPVTGLKPRKAYDRKFAHVASKDVCFECHDQHSLKVRVTECATCHVNQNGDPIVSAPPANAAEYEAAIDNLHEVRMAGTINDFEATATRRKASTRSSAVCRTCSTLRSALTRTRPRPTGPARRCPPRRSHTRRRRTRTSSSTRTATASSIPVRRPATTPGRLACCAPPTTTSTREGPGAFAHNAKYLIEVLYDAIADLNAVHAVPGFANLVRNDSGHFDTSAEVYRHWDEDTDHLVDPSCSRCHSVEGFLFRVKYGIDQTIPAPLSSGMTCETCHETGTSFSPMGGNKPARRYVASVTFPYPTTATSTQIANVTIANGTKGTAAEDDSYVCMTCHQGRESTLTVDAANPSNVTTFTLSFPERALSRGRRDAVRQQGGGRIPVCREDHAAPWNHGVAYSGLSAAETMSSALLSLTHSSYC